MTRRTKALLLAAAGAALVASAIGVTVPALVRGESPTALRDPIAARYPDVRWVDTATLARWMERQGDDRPILLDTRSAAEYDMSHLEGALRIDPETEDVASLDLPEGRPVVVYCSVGWRSGAIAQRLMAAREAPVYNLEGGLFQWANEGRPVYRDGERADHVHPYDEAWGQLLNEEVRGPLEP
jgi:rhodanese-related sulfurtransferase